MTSNETAQRPKWPEPVVLVAREGKGCRQYTFDTLEEFKAWTARKPYRDEALLVMPMHAKRFLGRETLAASEAYAFASKLVTEAKQYEEAATNLATAVLRQAENANQECAFWFLSALSKLHGARPDMRVGDALQFASSAMPTAAKQWTEYVAGTV